MTVGTAVTNAGAASVMSDSEILKDLVLNILDLEQEAYSLSRFERKDLEEAWHVYADALEESALTDRSKWARLQCELVAKGLYSQIARRSAMATNKLPLIPDRTFIGSVAVRYGPCLELIAPPVIE